MKHLLAFIALAVAAFAASSPTVSIDLYGNVFVNGENTNRQIADFARDPANFALAPQIDAAVRDAALAARAKIAADVKAAQDATAAKESQLATARARIAQLEAALRSANVPVPSAP